jgi:phosphoglucomutase
MKVADNAIGKVSPYAGQLPEAQDLVDVTKLICAYENDQPDPLISSQKVRFGTSGHRGSSFDRSFNRHHILAITQAVCLYRKRQNITGPLFLGFDTHALSLPAFQTTLEVLAASDVTVMVAKDQEFTPTPAVSHAILTYNKGRTDGFADGIVITPSHNPPKEGGVKYNPPHGGPAESAVSAWIESQANTILTSSLSAVRTIPFAKAMKTRYVHQHDFLTPFIQDLGNVIDMDIIRESQISIGVDPLGGAGVHYWQPIAEFYKINLFVLRTEIDARFQFMTRDWDGQIRMDPSSPYAMASLIQNGQQYDISFGCDTDHDRHGIVTKCSGLMPPNHYLATAIFYLFKNRPQWKTSLKIGKTLVSSQMIDRVANAIERSVVEVPVGFKWFVDGLLQGKTGFAGEESAGASFLRKDGSVWTTDKDGFAPSLLAAEMTAKTGKDPAKLYEDLTDSFGAPAYKRIDAPATALQKEKISHFSAASSDINQLGGDRVDKILTTAPGNNAPIGGFKIETKNGWIAVRPSGTEDIYKIYGESFLGQEHLEKLLAEGQQIVNKSSES